MTRIIIQVSRQTGDDASWVACVAARAHSTSIVGNLHWNVGATLRGAPLADGREIEVLERNHADWKGNKTMRLSKRSARGLLYSSLSSTQCADGGFYYRLDPDSEDRDLREASVACKLRGLPTSGHVDKRGVVYGIGS